MKSITIPVHMYAVKPVHILVACLSLSPVQRAGQGDLPPPPLPLLPVAGCRRGSGGSCRAQWPGRGSAELAWRSQPGSRQGGLGNFAGTGGGIHVDYLGLVLIVNCKCTKLEHNYVL